MVAAVYGPTTAKDDLWQIALRYKLQNASINQVMLAIVRLNPYAFKDGNVNGLKVGGKLKIPSYPMIMKISPTDATKEVSAHMRAWKDKISISH